MPSIFCPALATQAECRRSCVGIVLAPGLLAQLPCRHDGVAQASGREPYGVALVFQTCGGRQVCANPSSWLRAHLRMVKDSVFLASFDVQVAVIFWDILLRALGDGSNCGGVDCSEAFAGTVGLRLHVDVVVGVVQRCKRIRDLLVAIERFPVLSPVLYPLPSLLALLDLFLMLVHVSVGLFHGALLAHALVVRQALLLLLLGDAGILGGEDRGGDFGLGGGLDGRGVFEDQRLVGGLFGAAGGARVLRNFWEVLVRWRGEEG